MFSIIIPTIGRYTLERTLRSIRLTRDDEVIVIGDGKRPIAKCICKSLKKEVPYDLRYFKGPATNNWGNEQRNFGMDKAKGYWLMFIDDDDIYVPDAFVHVRKATKENGAKPHIFRMHNRTWDREIRWFNKRLDIGNIGTPMLCFPNIADKLGQWPEYDEYGGDNVFIRNTLKLWPKKSVVWCKDVIVLVRPEL